MAPNLREEIRLLAEVFTPTHDVFRIIRVTPDQLSCTFLPPNEGASRYAGNPVDIVANLSDCYPEIPVIFSTESEESGVVMAIEETISGGTLSQQLHRLLRALSALYQIESLKTTLASMQPADSGKSSPVPMEGDEPEEEDDDEDVEDDSDSFFYDDLINGESGERSDEGQGSSSGAGDQLGVAEVEIIERLKRRQFDEHAKQALAKTTSTHATNRLMKELVQIYNSAGYKSGDFKVEVNDDNLYKWMVFISNFDSDSQLAKDMIRVKVDAIKFEFTFDSQFPFNAPFVRVVSPLLNGGYVINGGAICMELLTKQGWSGAYSIESVIHQISATLVKGHATIKSVSPNFDYSYERAVISYKHIQDYHQKNGWFTPKMGDG